MIDTEITYIDDKNKELILMLKRNVELSKLPWYQSEEQVPIDKETNELNEICGSVELGREKEGALEYSGQTERNYTIECRVSVWVPPKLRAATTPTLNEFRQRIKKVFNDAEDGVTDFPKDIVGYKYLGSEPFTLGVRVHGTEKTISKVLVHESALHYALDNF
jgi:hypothetical protein